MSVRERTATTLLLSLDSLPEMNYTVNVTWEKTYPNCPHFNSSYHTVTTDGPTEYLIAGLHGGSSYTITVRVTNVVGSNISDPISNMTLETGIANIMHVGFYILLHHFIHALSSLCCSSEYYNSQHNTIYHHSGVG